MDISMESLHTSQGPRGAIVRRRGLRELRTLAVIPTPDGLHHVEVTLTHPGDVLAWTTCTYRTPSAEVTMERDGEALVIGGSRRDVPADTLPSYAASVLLEDMLAQCATEAEFHRLVEDTPDAAPQPAHFSVGNPEQVRVADGREVELGVVDLYLGDAAVETTGSDALAEPAAAQRFWFDSHDIVVSDWGGARSYRVDSLDELLDGMDPEAAAIARAFCG